MKAFFLLSCLLLFMASGVDQTKSQQTSSPTGSTMSADPLTLSQSSSQSTPTMETPTTFPQRTSQATSASTMETPKTTTQGGSPPTKASTTEPPTTTTQGGSPPTKASTTESPTTTTQGGNQTTNASTTESPTTTIQGGNQTTNVSTTQLPTTTTQGGNQTTAPPPSVPDEPCTKMRCYSTAQCINLKNESFCLCPEGYYYKDQECNPGKTFPGILNIGWDISDLDDPKSQNYQNLHLKVQSFFQSAFSNDSTFGQTVILSLQTRSKMRSTERVEIMVTNLFNITSKITEKTVNEAIMKQVGQQEGVFLSR
ncbi:mucin-13-like [Antechinus flavipes]|uniref:mucin-13-like n=1 Tax=Antechinus flavipes TaxID=38775 RepID=UPI002235863D|nr:mucin-13-like [Antechinus flavipes]